MIPPTVSAGQLRPVRPIGPLVIEIEGVTKLYQMGEETIHALRGVSLKIHRNEYLAIMGPSGSGKSTLMNMLGCLDRPTSGRYLLDGIDVSSLDRNERADIRNQKLGFVFQGFNLLARTTALENVELPMLYAKKRISSREMRERAMQALDIVGLSKRFDHYPSQLSGGQQQRVAIARALVNQPQVLLADEPTGNLDSTTGAKIIELLFDLNRELGTTLVLITHEERLAQRCQRRIELDAGRLAATGATI